MKRLTTTLVLQMILSALPVPEAMAADWPCWRGPEQTGFARETAVVTHWSDTGGHGENLLWKRPIGGRTTPVLLDGRLFFIGPVGTGECLQERVVCLDSETGRLLWEHRFNVVLTTIVESRVGWTAVVADPETKNVYAHGTGGEFFCFDRDGKVLWHRSLTELYGRVSGYGGRLHTPIIDEDRVIVSFVSSNWGSHGRPGHRYLAMDKRTGDVVWWAMPGGKPLDTTYSVPFVTVINGVRMLIAANADGNVYAMKARTGERVWSFKLSKRGLNSSVVVDGTYAYVTHSEENYGTTAMGSVVCLDASLSGDLSEKGVVWRRDGITAGYASPALARGRLYVVDNAANLHCFDAKTGTTVWTHRLGRVGKGSPTVTADGVIYVATVNGRFLILKDTGDDCRELDVATFEGPNHAVVDIYGSPIVAGGRVYFMTRFATYCLGAKGRTAKTEPIPPMAAEAAPRPSNVAWLNVVPAEVTLAPGAQQRFTARAFDANGRFAGEHEVLWTAKKVAGSVDKDGVFTAATDQTFSGGLVEARLGAVRGMARVRICPKLPLSEDFEGMKPGSNPPGWVGLGRKTRLVALNGNVVLQKLAVVPSVPFMRMRAYSGPPISGGYTVQCDLMGRPKAGRRPMRPDMGLINSRYVLKMLGKERALRIVSWSPIPRLRKDVPLNWKTNVWYTARLRVELRDGNGLIRGKVWEREAEEPAGWQIEVVDPCPNREGSPGLYAYSKGTTSRKHGAPTFYDNYSVYVNE